MYRQFQNPDSRGGIRLTDQDVKAVIDLWIERQGLDPRPSVADVAEGLDISLAEVNALLEEVRARRTEVESGILQERGRVDQEQRLLAEEQERLWQAEDCLGEYHVRRSDLFQARLEVRQRLVLTPREPTRENTWRGKRCTNKTQSSHRITGTDNAMMIGVTLILTCSGLLLFWSILSALL